MRALLLARAREQLPGGASAIWPMDDGTGQTVRDISGNGSDGFLGTTSGSDTTDPAWTAAGVSFIIDPDATDDLVTMPTASVPSSYWSMVCIAKSVATTPGTQSPFGVRYDATANKLLRFNFTASTQTASMTTWNGTNSTTTIIGGSAGNWPNATWALCAIDFDRSAGAINGTFIVNNIMQQTAFSGATGLTSADVFRFGNSSIATTSPMDGGLAYGIVYPRILTSAEYLRIYRVLRRQLAARGVSL